MVHLIEPIISKQTEQLKHISSFYLDIKKTKKMFNTTYIENNKTVTKQCSFEFQRLTNGAPRKSKESICRFVTEHRNTYIQLDVVTCTRSEMDP